MKKLTALILSLIMAFTLCACGGKETSDESDLAYVQGKGKLIVGITEFNPMDYRDASDPTGWIGFDADVAKAFADSLGVDIEFIEIDWDNKIMELNSKSVDCLWNGMTLTPEVLNSMATTKPYCNNAQVVVLNADVADNYKDEESIKDLSFAVESGSAGEVVATEKGFNTVAVLTQADALMEVASGTSDACIIDLLMAGAMIGEGTSYPQLTYTMELTSEEYGVGFRQGSELAEKFNEFYKAAFESGQIQEIAEKYGVQESIICK